MDTDFRGVSFHAIKILPSRPQENVSKKREERASEREGEKVHPLKESLFSSQGGHHNGP